MDEVKKKAQSKYFYLTVLSLLKDGKNPSSISKELNIPKQNLNYYLRKIKNEGLIKKVGYGTWEIERSKNPHFEHTNKTSKKKIRGHAFIWTIKLNKEIDWKDKLKENKINYKLIRNSIPRTFILKKKVWFGKKSLTIYEPISFYGKDAIESRKYAVISLIETLKEIERKLKVNLKPYLINPAREHFALIRNDLAIQCNRNNEKIRIEDINGEWLWIDASDGFGELETGNRKAFENNLGVQKWWNDMKDTKFKVTPSFLMEQMNDLIQDRKYWAENQRTHVEAIKTLSEKVKELSEVIKELKK